MTAFLSAEVDPPPQLEPLLVTGAVTPPPVGEHFSVAMDTGIVTLRVLKASITFICQPAYAR